MIKIQPQYVVDEKQQRKAVLISLTEWERILDNLEELEDIRAYDKAKSGPQDTVPFEQAVREIEDGYKI
jgi:PHD/YefM family antitoxin component YafN of YafNO toxin-antitoxin module